MNGREIQAVIQERLQASLNHLVEQKWLNLGLRAKMGMMVTFGLAGLLTIFALLGISAARQATEQVLNERMMLARMSATSLDVSLQDMENMLTVLAAQPILQDPLATPAERQAVFNHVAGFEDGIYLVEPQGSWIAPLDASPPPMDLASLELLSADASGNHLNLSVVQVTGPSGPHPWIVLAAPVLDPSGVPQAHIVALVDLATPALFPQQRPFDLGASGTVDVVDAQGLVLLSTSSSRVLTRSDPGGVIANLFVADQPGVETCLGCYGQESGAQDEVIAFAPLTHAPWGVVVRQKAEELFAPVRRLTLLTVILGLATVLGALGLVWITTNSVIKPVQSLTEAAHRIAEGDLTTPVRVQGLPRPHTRGRLDEIGALAESFYSMRSRLKASIEEIQAWNRELDARVRERTQAALSAQEEAQAARDDLRAIIDALNDELVVVDVESRKIQLANQAALASRQEQGGTLGAVCYQAYHCGTPCRPPDGECPIPQVVATGEAVKVIHEHPDRGTQEPRHIEVTASPMRDGNGVITRVVELSRDITVEKNMRASLERRNQQLSILNSVSLTVNQSLHLEDILGKALDEVLNLTGIDVGAVFLQEDPLGSLNLRAFRGLSQDAARLAAQMGLLDGSCGGVVEKGQLVIVPDISKYRGRRAISLRREQLCTLVHVPLMAKGCVLGSMCVGTRQPREFRPEEQELLVALGSQIAVAVDNARLYAELQLKEHLRGELFKQALTAQEEERKRIARELHDETSQTLTALLFAAEESLDMETLGEVKTRLQGMRELAQHTLDGVHKIIFDLRPTMLDHLGLVPAIRWLAKARLEPKEVRVVVEETGERRRLTPEIETALFRVVQEAITNVSRHSAARSVCILLQFETDQIVVRVEDDGVGFQVDELGFSPENPRGLGLLSMQERVALLGGELEVSAAPGEGTQIYIRVPTHLTSEREEL